MKPFSVLNFKDLEPYHFFSGMAFFTKLKALILTP